jgi:PTH2 family peptidyl-tRNA hydrolase
LEELKVKQVIVYRRDLNMRKGKIAAQVAHASMKVFFDRGTVLPAAVARVPTLTVPLTNEMASWVQELFGKIVLTVESEEDLLKVYEEAKARGIPTALVTDAGRTEFKAECDTCAGLGFLNEFLGPNDELLDPPQKVTCPTCHGDGKVGVPTHTTVAVGPAPASQIDVITGPDGLVQTKLA